MIPFVAAVLLGASIAIVAWPLLKGKSGMAALAAVEDSEISELLSQKDATLLAISELESDYNMGNLSGQDYRDLRQKYEEKALSLIKTVDERRGERGVDIIGQIDAEIEAEVSNLRSGNRPEKGRLRQPVGKACPGCGAALSPDDRFCSHCGAAKSATCPACSAAIEPDDRFCSHCGAALGPGRRGAPA